MQQNYKKGEIINVNLGAPPTAIKGHEQALERPCIIIQAFNSLELVIIIPLTSKAPKYNIYTIVKVIKNNAGLTTDSYALCHQIRTISVDRIINKRGILPPTDLLKIQAVLIDTLDL